MEHLELFQNASKYRKILRRIVKIGGGVRIWIFQYLFNKPSGFYAQPPKVSTDLRQLAAVARRATLTIGNDSGPTHMAAAAGCPTLALFGDDSDPALCAPRGQAVRVLRHHPLAELPVDSVLQEASALSAGG